MDPAEMSVARARGFAIHPEDPLVASTIDRLLGARRETDAPATAEAAGVATAAARRAARRTTTAVDGDPTATNGVEPVHLGGADHSR